MSSATGAEMYYRAVMSKDGSRLVLRSKLFSVAATADEQAAAKLPLTNQIALHRKMGYACLAITKEPK